VDAGSTAAPVAGFTSPAGRVVGGTTEPIDAATVLLLRDGPTGLEVFLLERHLKSDFAGGAYAFPGGKVDAQDRGLDPARVTGLEADRWTDRLGARDPATVVGLWVAAVRETFEEAGLLLARRRDGTELAAADLASESFVAARQRLAARGEHWDWRPWLEAEDLVLDLGALTPFAWWITPHGMHKRFDTRFFAAVAPAAQMAALAHDDVETTASRWCTPAAALEDAAAGRAVIIFPTRRNLQGLAEFDRADDVLAAGAAGRLDLRPVLPALTVIDGTVHVRHPDGGQPESV
jgi:8-oxo-dGTP pyrophosphatase MutT (NUDIX family)